MKNFENSIFFIPYIGMKVEELIEELDTVVANIKMKIMYYQTENKELRRKIVELKKYVKEK